MLWERCDILAASYRSALGKTNYSCLDIPFTPLIQLFPDCILVGFSKCLSPPRHPEPSRAVAVSYFPQSSLSHCVSTVNVCTAKLSCVPYGKRKKAMDSKFICRACESFIGLFLTQGYQADALSVSSTQLFPKSIQ